MSDDEKTSDNLENAADSLISDMVLSDTQDNYSRGRLIVEPGAAGKTGEYEREIQETLSEAELAGKTYITEDLYSSWALAHKTVLDFKPVPFFIYRVSSYVLSRPGEIKPVSDGLLFGLRRLLFAVASDDLLGAGKKVKNVRQAISVSKPDVIAASAAIYAICRKLAGCQFERIWRPILDDALVRARIGYHVGQYHDGFGCGRGMLSGFAGRMGLAVLIASGNLDKARTALEQLAIGKGIRDVGLDIYGCDPLQVSAFVLSASGCGRDAAFGTASYSAHETLNPEYVTDEQKLWISCFVVCEKARTMKLDEVEDADWETMNITESEQKEKLQQEVKMIVRRGHGWNWFVS